MGKLDIPPIPEFIQMIAHTGTDLYGCQASCDLFGVGKDDLIDQVTGIITVGDSYALGAGGPDHLLLSTRPVPGCGSR
jgi:peroxiredoxin family protein